MILGEKIFDRLKISIVEYTLEPVKYSVSEYVYHYLINSIWRNHRLGLYGNIWDTTFTPIRNSIIKSLHEYDIR